MLVNGKEAIGSMGIDTPLAVLSDKPQLLFNYFKQLFAQVTNPPLDGIREEIVTDISLTLGEEFNLFEISDKHARKLFIENPIISNEDLDKISCLDQNNLKAAKIPILYEVDMGFNGIEISMGEIVNKIDNEITNGANIVILSDRGVSSTLAPIPVYLLHLMYTTTLKDTKKGPRSALLLNQLNQGSLTTLHYFLAMVQAQSILIW